MGTYKARKAHASELSQSLVRSVALNIYSARRDTFYFYFSLARLFRHPRSADRLLMLCSPIIRQPPKKLV